MIGEKNYSLNEIIKEMYMKKENIKEIKDYHITIHKNFKDEKIKDLKKICNTLDIDIDSFKDKKGNYNIPILVRAVIEEYLTAEGKKGSLISKLRSGKIEEITPVEKKEFIEGLMESVRSSQNYSDEEKELLLIAAYKYLYDIKYLSYLNARQAVAINHAIETLNTDITNLRNKNLIDGLIRFNNSDKIKRDFDEDGKSISTVNIKVEKLEKYATEKMYNTRSFLVEEDMDKLIDVYERLINEISERWNDMVNYYQDIKSEYIDSGMIEKIKSEDILKQALEELGEHKLIFNEHNVSDNDK